FYQSGLIFVKTHRHILQSGARRLSATLKQLSAGLSRRYRARSVFEHSQQKKRLIILLSSVRTRPLQNLVEQTGDRFLRVSGEHLFDPLKTDFLITSVRDFGEPIGYNGENVARSRFDWVL